MALLLIISSDMVGERMAGVGIRYWHMAAALARHGLDVVLAVPGEDLVQGEGFEVVPYSHSHDLYQSLTSYLTRSQAVLVSGYTVGFLSLLRQSDIPIIVDLWAPFVLENLEVVAEGPMEARMAAYRDSVTAINEQLQIGDFFLCASERQRDFWLGMLAANNRINPCVYAQDPTLYRLLAVVPYGLPVETPRHAQDVLKGVHPGIAEGDRVLLWSGGIWEWYDPLTLIRALAQVLGVRSDVKLVFLGTRHPNPGVGGAHIRKLNAAIELCQKLGLYDQHVFFTDWVPYDEMQNYLLEADIGVVLHHSHVETRFSFRARLLSYIWAGLPVLITEGSPSSDIVRSEGLGSVVGYEDIDETASAIMHMLSLPDLREHHRPGFERARERFTWDRVVQPVFDFCQKPHAADDRGRIVESRSCSLEVARLQEIIAGYERGRFIRFMNWLHRVRRTRMRQ